MRKGHELVCVASEPMVEEPAAMAFDGNDALKGDLRDNGGQGVHFSGSGLRDHAARWVKMVAPWQQKPLE